MSTDSPRIDLQEARRFLDILDPGAAFRSMLSGLPDGFTFQTFDDVRDRKRRDLASIQHGTFDDVATTLKRYNRQRAGVFITINETDGTGRALANIVRVRAVWLEDDSGASAPLPLAPHLVTETSPGKYHHIILVDGLSFDQHQQVQRVLIEQYGSDPNAKDIARVLRVPGFYHCKGELFRVKLLQALERPPYSAAEVLAAFKPGDTLPAPRSRTYEPPARSDSSDPDLSLSDPLPDINLDNAAQYLPPAGDQTYSEWLQVGLALHHQFQGSADGLFLFDQWSQDVREYQGYDDVAATWYSIGGRTDAGITFKTLIKAHQARQAKAQSAQDLSAYESGLRLISDCTDYLLLVSEVAPKLRRLANANVVLESDFQTALREHYARLRPGSALSKEEVRKAFKTNRGKRDNGDAQSIGLNDSRIPEWAKNWVWVSQDEIFFNVVTRVSLTSAGFSAHYNSNLPSGDGAPVEASKYLRDNNLIPKVMGVMYSPENESLFNFEGVDYVNSYSDSFRAPVPATILNQTAVQRFQQHVELVCGGWNREAQILVNWLAMATGSPPMKIRWSPLLVGVYGDGKSLFFDFACKALGQSNCRTVSCSTIIAGTTSGQSGWSEGACFGFIEEIKLHGHNRHDVMNNLKVYITNSVVPCKKMHKEVRNIRNTINYFITTNFADAAPIELGDRRYFVLHSKLPLADLETDYFMKLYEGINNDAGSILAWLRSVEIHPDFKINGPAPMTDDKQVTIRLTTDDTKDKIAEIIEDDNCEEYRKEYVLFDSLLNRLSAAAANVRTDNSKLLSNSLASLGYVKLGRARVLGHRHSIWINEKAMGRKLELGEAKEMIEAKLKDAEKKGLKLVSN